MFCCNSTPFCTLACHVMSLVSHSYQALLWLPLRPQSSRYVKYILCQTLQYIALPSHSIVCTKNRISLRFAHICCSDVIHLLNISVNWYCILHVWRIEVTCVDEYYISGRWVLHIWTTVTYLDGNISARHTTQGVTVSTAMSLTSTRFLSLARSKLRLCSTNHMPGYFSNLAFGWLSIVWVYTEIETESGSSSLAIFRSQPHKGFPQQFSRGCR